MTTTVITMRSVTQAIKAQRFLQSQGYFCSIQRASKVSISGCTHIIITNCPEEIVFPLMDKHNILHGILVKEKME